MQQSLIEEKLDDEVRRCLLTLEPRVRELIRQRHNFKLTINATHEDKRRYRFRAELYETLDLE